MLLFCDLFLHYLMWVLQVESLSVGFPKTVLMCPSLHPLFRVCSLSGLNQVSTEGSFREIPRLFGY